MDPCMYCETQKINHIQSSRTPSYGEGRDALRQPGEDTLHQYAVCGGRLYIWARFLLLQRFHSICSYLLFSSSLFIVVCRSIRFLFTTAQHSVVRDSTVLYTPLYRKKKDKENPLHYYRLLPKRSGVPHGTTSRHPAAAMSSREKGKGNTMVLPNIPKMTDDKNRIKYMTDYEKYEPELLKHHIGSADTTTTIGLKNFPAEFDRTVPSPTDPTVAEKEYDKYIAQRNARRRKKHFPAPTLKPSVTITKPKLKETAVVSSSPQPSLEPRNSTPGKEHLLEPAASDITAATPSAGAGVPPILAEAAAASPGAAVVLHTPTSVSRPQRMMRGPGKLSTDVTRSGSSVLSKTSNRSTPQEEPMHKMPLPESAAASSTQARRSPSASTRQPSASSSRSVPHPSRPPKPTSSFRQPSKPAARSPPRAPPRPVVLDDREPTKSLTAEEVQKYLAENCPTSPRAIAVEPANVGEDINECADMLRVLVNPPQEFAASVKLDLRGMDIDWIAEKRRRPGQLTTLQNWQSMTPANGVPKITSPRSVLVMLRNGVSTSDLKLSLPKDDDYLLPQDPVLRAAVKRYRMEREKVRRDTLSELLLSDYLSLSSQFSQSELIFAVNKPPDVAEKIPAMPTSLLERQERQRKQFEINKMRLSREQELAEAVEAKRLIAEERKQRAVEEQRAAMEAKAKAEEEQRKMQQRRLEEQKRKLQEMEKLAMENLRQRQELAEKRNEERALAQAQQFEERQKIRHEKEAERQRRFAHVARMREEQAAMVLQKREEVEQKLAQIEESRRLQAEEEKKLLREKQLKVKEARREAARRAAEQEEKIRQAALEKQQQVELRIQKFIESREEQAQRRAEEERMKTSRRREAFESAILQEEELKKVTEAKRLEHELRYGKVQTEKTLSMTLHREREREELASKAATIRMMQRVQEFKKLQTVAELIEKKRVAEHLEKQRADILARSIAERDKMNLEKEALRHKLESIKVLLLWVVLVYYFMCVLFSNCHADNNENRYTSTRYIYMRSSLFIVIIIPERSSPPPSSSSTGERRHFSKSHMKGEKESNDQEHKNQLDTWIGSMPSFYLRIETNPWCYRGSPHTNRQPQQQTTFLSSHRKPPSVLHLVLVNGGQRATAATVFIYFSHATSLLIHFTVVIPIFYTRTAVVYLFIHLFYFFEVCSYFYSRLFGIMFPFGGNTGAKKADVEAPFDEPGPSPPPSFSLCRNTDVEEGSVPPPATQQRPPLGLATQGTAPLPRPDAPVNTPYYPPEGGPRRQGEGVFGGGVLRPPGARYGDNDLLPGGGLDPAGSSLINERNFHSYMHSLYGGEAPGSGGASLPRARYDPMFPGDHPGFDMRVPGSRVPDAFPGEPDNDILQPPGLPFGAPQRGGRRGGGPFSGFSYQENMDTEENKPFLFLCTAVCFIPDAFCRSVKHCSLRPKGLHLSLSPHTKKMFRCSWLMENYRVQQELEPPVACHSRRGRLDQADGAALGATQVVAAAPSEGKASAMQWINPPPAVRPNTHAGPFLEAADDAPLPALTSDAPSHRKTTIMSEMAEPGSPSAASSRRRSTRRSTVSAFFARRQSRTAPRLPPAKLREYADVLRVILNPPKEFAASVQLDLRGMDLDWVAEKRRRPIQLTTLQNWENSTAPNAAPKINSPRSVLVLLESGVTTNDLRPRVVSKDEELNLPLDPVQRAAVLQFRAEREVERLERLTDHLLTQYTNLCELLQQKELLTAVNKVPEMVETVPPSFVELFSRIKKRGERDSQWIGRVVKNQEQYVTTMEQTREEVSTRMAKAEERQRAMAEHEQCLLREKKQRQEESRREAARRAAEHAEQIRQAALEKQREADQRLERRSESQGKRVQRLAERSRQDGMRHREAFEKVLLAQEQSRMAIQSQRELRDRAYKASQAQKALTMALRHEEERNKMSKKVEAIHMMQRVGEYHKVHTLAQVLEKRRVGEYMEQQRADLLTKSVVEREKLKGEHADRFDLLKADESNARPHSLIQMSLLERTREVPPPPQNEKEKKRKLGYTLSKVKRKINSHQRKVTRASFLFDFIIIIIIIFIYFYACYYCFVFVLFFFPPFPHRFILFYTRIIVCGSRRVIVLRPPPQSTLYTTLYVQNQNERWHAALTQLTFTLGILSPRNSRWCAISNRVDHQICLISSRCSSDLLFFSVMVDDSVNFSSFVRYCSGKPPSCFSVSRIGLQRHNKNSQTNKIDRYAFMFRRRRLWSKAHSCVGGVKLISSSLAVSKRWLTAGSVRRPGSCWTAPLIFVPTMVESKRPLKTLDVREYRPLSFPIEFRFYQRYTSHPNRQSGIQFLTHYSTHQRFRVNHDFIDYMHWGKEQGQARLPHRHQRVAFDFFDSLPPTRADGQLSPEEQTRWFHEQDPSIGPHPDMDANFDPNRKTFSNPEHWNRMFSKRRPGQGDIRLDALNSPSLLGPLVTQTDTQETSYFHTETRGPTHGRVPGLNAPFLGEMDRKMMQAMAHPLNKDHTLATREGRFSKVLYINDPKRHQALSAQLAQELNTEIDRCTNAVYSKLTVLEAAQSGETDFFCGGMDMERLGFDLKMANMLRQQAAHLRQHVEKKETNSSPTAGMDGASGAKRDEARATELERDAVRHEDRADLMLREHGALVIRAHSAARPLMVLVNGKCRGTGCGLAVGSKLCALKDISEFIFDGPHMGVTPYGGLTRWLARPETSLKFPGLAEFVMLTGTSLFAGDALRLGWTDLFTTLPDITYHIQDWFNTSEHMHNDAVAWQLGHLLDTCFRMKEAHTSEMERCAITPVRSRWVEDAFADQPSLEAVMQTLTEMEQLSLSDPLNTADACRATPFTLRTVKDAVRVLSEHRLRYTLAPFDITPPEDPVEVRQAAEIFTSYVLERRGSVDVSVHKDREKLRRWQSQREREYRQYRSLRAAPHARHVYARLEGCENLLVSFEHVFEVPAGAEAEARRVSGDDSTALNALRKAVLTAMKMPLDREIEIGWYVSTLDSCPVRNDEELLTVLHNDPGMEDPREKLRYPPVYFVVKRSTLHLSEWAYAVKHQLLLSSPYALAAAWELLHEVRGDGSEEAVKSLADTLNTEFKYISRAMRRPDFFAVGQYTTASAEEWEEIKRNREANLHQSMLPRRPIPHFEDVFERNVELSGHRFTLRPRWSPRTLEEVCSDETLGPSLRQPLEYETDGVPAFDADTYCHKADRLAGMVEDAGGVQVVPGLGEKTPDGIPLVPPRVSDAHVPTNVNFYEMARHPWDDTPSSWRQHGFTEGSKAYYEKQYKEAERRLYESEQNHAGGYSYWPSKEGVEGTGAGEEDGAQLLKERLFGEFQRAERGVESWARDLRQKALDGKLDYKLEIATQQEKIYDDEYYRWFIQPGHHPNPSGLLVGSKGKDRSPEDVELSSFIDQLMTESMDRGAVDLPEEVATPMAVPEDVSSDLMGDTVEDIPPEDLFQMVFNCSGLLRHYRAHMELDKIRGMLRGRARLERKVGLKRLFFLMRTQTRYRVEQQSFWNRAIVRKNVDSAAREHGASWSHIRNDSARHNVMLLPRMQQVLAQYEPLAFRSLLEVYGSRIPPPPPPKTAEIPVEVYQCLCSSGVSGEEAVQVQASHPAAQRELRESVERMLRAAGPLHPEVALRAPKGVVLVANDPIKNPICLHTELNWLHCMLLLTPVSLGCGVITREKRSLTSFALSLKSVGVRYILGFGFVLRLCCLSFVSTLVISIPSLKRGEKIEENNGQHTHKCNRKSNNIGPDCTKGSSKHSSCPASAVIHSMTLFRCYVYDAAAAVASCREGDDSCGESGSEIRFFYPPSTSSPQQSRTIGLALTAESISKDGLGTAPPAAHHSDTSYFQSASIETEAGGVICVAAWAPHHPLRLGLEVQPLAGTHHGCQWSVVQLEAWMRRVGLLCDLAAGVDWLESYLTSCGGTQLPPPVCDTLSVFSTFLEGVVLTEEMLAVERGGGMVSVRAQQWRTVARREAAFGFPTFLQLLEEEDKDVKEAKGLAAPDSDTKDSSQRARQESPPAEALVLDEQDLTVLPSSLLLHRKHLCYTQQEREELKLNLALCAALDDERTVLSLVCGLHLLALMLLCTKDISLDSTGEVVAQPLSSSAELDFSFRVFLPRRECAGEAPHRARVHVPDFNTSESGAARRHLDRVITISLISEKEPAAAANREEIASEKRAGGALLGVLRALSSPALAPQTQRLQWISHVAIGNASIVCGRVSRSFALLCEGLERYEDQWAILAEMLLDPPLTHFCGGIPRCPFAVEWSMADGLCCGFTDPFLQIRAPQTSTDPQRVVRVGLMAWSALRQVPLDAAMSSCESMLKRLWDLFLPYRRLFASLALPSFTLSHAYILIAD
eukprot:gene8217-5741_t